MRACEPFQPEDLEALDRMLLAHADAVVPMDVIAAGETDPLVIGLRHDVDNVIEPAVALAEWEHQRGYAATYYALHTAPYWDDKTLLRSSLERISELGHEIGFHTNAIAAALDTGRDPVEIVEEAVDELRGYGFAITGVVAHGDPLCHRANFVNDEMFVESPRPDYGAHDRLLEHDGASLRLQPIERARFGFEYDANWLPRAAYLSESGGRWSAPFAPTAACFPFDGQLHMLVHPCWWSEAFAEVRVG